MKLKTISLIAVAVILVAGGIGVAVLHGKPAAEAEAPADAEPSALIKSQRMEKRQLDNTISVYGDVVAGKPVAINFPQAGQIALMSVVLGQQVRRGEVLAVMTADPQAQAAYAQAQNAVTLAAGELKRNEELFALQLATQSQVDTARKQLRDGQDALAAQKKMAGGVGSGSGSLTLAAPFDAVVIALTAAAGDRIAAGAPVLQLAPLGGLRIQLGLMPEQSAAVSAGMPVSISTVQDASSSFNAKIAAVQKLVDPKSQVVNVMVDIPPDSRLPLVLGMHVQGSIQLAKLDAWSVPRQAVLADDKGHYIYQVNHDKVRRVAVEIAVESADKLGIRGEVDAALPVVISGNYELQDGMRVREAAR